jgi:hypothetical protein
VNYKVSHVRISSFPIQVTTSTRNITPDSRLIEIAQAAKHPLQHPSEQDVAEGVVHDPTSEADTASGPAPNLLFVHESELDNAIGETPAVVDVAPAEEVVPEEETPQEMLQERPAEVPEPVGAFASMIRKLY